MFDVVDAVVNACVVDDVAGCVVVVVVVVVTPDEREGEHCLVVVAFGVVGDCHLLDVDVVVVYFGVCCLFVGPCYCYW